MGTPLHPLLSTLCHCVGTENEMGAVLIVTVAMVVVVTSGDGGHGSWWWLVMDTGMAPRDGSQVRGITGQGQAWKFPPVTFPSPFWRVTGQ